MLGVMVASFDFTCHPTCHNMSGDMSTIAATKRKRQILEAAIEIISPEGYANLSMRALARASDPKLGALQYQFPTWEV